MEVINVCLTIILRTPVNKNHFVIPNTTRKQEGLFTLLLIQNFKTRDMAIRGGTDEEREGEG